MSGYSVPCAKSHLSSVKPQRSAISSRTRIKVSPTMCRFFCGSVSPAIACKKVCEASSTIKLVKPKARYRSAIRALSFLRIKPLSMCNPVTRSFPSAWFKSAKVTVESTPPDKNSNTLRSFACSRICSIINLSTVS